MHWFITLILLVIAASTSQAAEMYRWVDEDGVVTFSDTPRPGAERIELRGIQTTRFASPGAPATTRPEPAADTEEAGYDSISISRPQPEETIWNVEGMLDVQVAVQPSIQSGHRLRLYLDGQEVVGVPDRATSFTIDRVFRGMHTLRAAVVDSGGSQLISSDSVRFYVQQTSVLNPNNPNRPAPPTRPRPRPRG